VKRLDSGSVKRLDGGSVKRLDSGSVSRLDSGPVRRIAKLTGTSAVLALVPALAAPAFASAHALQGRSDLPIPEWLFAWGASIVLIVSFVALSLAWREPRFEGDQWRPFNGGFARAIVSRPMEVVCGAIGVFLFVVAIYSGLKGTEEPDRNFALTFLFITGFLGFAVVSAVFGDVFRAFNPWRAIARTASGLYRLAAGSPAPPAMTYPERFGRWPAAVGLVAFVWLELIYGSPVAQSVGLTPRTAVIAALAYSAYTFVGMALYGIEKWLERGETFAVYFGMFSRLSPLEVRDGRLGRRPWLSGTSGWAKGVPGSIALVLATIGTTTFDGAQEGTLSSPIQSTISRLQDWGAGELAAARITNTIFLAVSLTFVAALYFGGVRGMQSVGGGKRLRELTQVFAHSFIPIGLAYLVAHYFSYFWFNIQAQFGYLLSDPLGNGSNLFGTSANGIDYTSIGSSAIWYVQVGALVAGHVAALILGHDKALSIYGDVRRATRSQYWMLALMVGFTSLGLFLLSQANG
jgi:hypothetical protein